MDEKLEVADWVSKYFYKEPGHNYYTSNYERQVIGFTPSDQSHYKNADLKREYKAYLTDANDFNHYDESTNEKC